MDAVYPPSVHTTSVAATATPIVVPRLAELTDSATSSPAITTTGAGSMAPSVSPMAPAYNMNSAMGGGGGGSVDMNGSAVARAKPTTKSQAGMNGGRWTEQEHQSFLAGLRLYGREWKKVASKIKTRTSAQIRSHAQKYFAKLARDDETRKLGHGLASPADGVNGAGAQTSSLYGYMSDDGSSTTAGNLSGDEGGDTDSSSSHQQRPTHQAPSSQQPRSLMPVHPFSSTPTPQGGHATGMSMSSASSLFTSLLPAHKKRPRPLGSASDLLSPLASSSLSHSFKQRKIEASLNRLPSPEELVEEVSPRVRQRLSSLIESEICALQVLSCYTWLQQQQQQNDLKVQLQAPPSVRTPHRLVGGGPNSSSSASAPSAVFPSPGGSSMSLAMITAERTPSIF